jgi:TRAP-type C4-dicarboxylate transport system permease small subunit
MLRSILDGLYRLSGYLAGFFLAAIAALIVAQIVGRFIGVAIDAVEVSGFCMAASTFLGLASALKHGTHIRVNLLIRRFSGTTKKAAELWCTGVGALAIGYFSYQAILMTWDTFRFGDMTKGLIIMDLWIPQTAMATGAVILTLALADEFVQVLRGREPAYVIADPLAQAADQL